MHSVVCAAIMVADIMNLGVTVVTACYTVICSGGLDLVEFDLAVFPAFIGKTGL